MTIPKVILPTALASLLGGVVLLFAAERPVLKVDSSIKQRKSHSDLAKVQAVRHTTPAGEKKEVRLSDVNKTTRRLEKEKRGLISRSSVISYGNNWTLVPREAILHVPANYGKRVDDVREGKLLGWHDFHTKNRNWIKLHSVTIEQARGDVPIDDQLLKSLRSTGRLVVATCQGGPISVKKPKELPAEPEAAAAHLAEIEKKKSRDAEELKALMKRLQNQRK